MSRLFTTLLLLWSGSALAQVNYVLNPDFEAFSYCPQGFEDIKAAKFWTPIDSTGILNCGPEYCHVCATSPVCSVPQSGLYFQYPHSGSGMALMQLYIDSYVTVPAYQDYVQGRLYKKLTAGKSYCVIFYVNIAEASKYAIKEIGAYLDNGTIDTNKNCKINSTLYPPQVINTVNFLNDTAKWIKIQGSLVAKGNEEFITIGNFKENAQTQAIVMPHCMYNGGGHIALYLLDDVSVIESDLPAYAGPDTHAGKGDSVYIGRPKEVGLECTWSVLGSTAVIGTGAGMWVRPAATTSYVVTQTLCGVVKKDTVRVEVWGVGVSGINGQGVQAYSLSPNPNNGQMTLIQSMKDEAAVDIIIFNALGATVYSGQKTFQTRTAALELYDISTGLYYLVLRDSAGDIYTLKFVKQ